VYKTSKNTFLKFRAGLCVEEVTMQFLSSFESWYNNSHSTSLNSSASIHLRNLRTVLNWLNVNEKLPSRYKYPFGKGKFSIKSIIKPKQTLTQEEISRLIELNDFQSREEEKARDLWLMQYYCNGVNMNDLLRLRWDNQIGNCFVIQREKTKTTTSTRPVFIRIPVIDRLSSLLDKLGKRESPYVLGILREGMSESQILEKRRKLSNLMNPHLKEIGKRLGFSIELLSETSRDAYATTLKRNGRSMEEIAEMLGHSSIVCTRNYLAQFEDSQLHDINSALP
jgi:integrase